MHIFIQFGLLILFIFAALAFGAVHVWAYSVVYSILLILTALVLVLVAIEYFVGSKSPKHNTDRIKYLSRMRTPWFFLTIAFLIFVALQLAPLPMSLIRTISPYAAHLYTQAYSFLATAVPDHTEPLYAFLTVDRDKTVKSLLAATAYASFVFLMLWSLRKPKEVDRFSLLLIVFSTLLCLYGFLRVLTNSTSIWGWEGHDVGADRVSATLINPDHFGAYLVMSIFLTFGYLLSYLRGRPTYMGKTALRRMLNMLSAEDSPAPKIFLLLFVIAVMGVGLLYTFSRGALLGLSVSMAFCLLLLSFKSRRRANFILVIPVILFVAYYAHTAGVDPLLERFEQTRVQLDKMDKDHRMILYQTGAQLYGRFPVFGSGLGTFPIVYPMVKAPQLRHADIDYAHNDWLQMATDVGAIGFLILLLLVGSAFFYLLRLWWKTDRPQGFGFGLAAIGGMLALAVHSLFDFSLRMPINSLFVLTLFCLAWVALKMPRERNTRTGKPPASWRIRLHNGFACVLICCLMLYASSAVIKYAIAEATFPTQMDSTRFTTPNISIPAVQRAAALNPLQSEYWLMLASLTEMLGFLAKTREPENGADGVSSQNKDELSALRRSLLLSPANSRCWAAWGEYLWIRAQEQSVPQPKMLQTADRAFDLSVQLDPTNIGARERICWYELWWWQQLRDRGDYAQSQAVVLDQLKTNLAEVLADQPKFLKKLSDTSKIKDLPQILGQVDIGQ